jgi:hypothetical protein
MIKEIVMIHVRNLLTLFMLFHGNLCKSQITWDTTMVLSRHEAGYGKFKPSIKAVLFFDNNIGFQVLRVRNALAVV